MTEITSDTPLVLTGFALHHLLLNAHVDHDALQCRLIYTDEGDLMLQPVKPLKLVQRRVAAAYRSEPTDAASLLLQLLINRILRVKELKTQFEKAFTCIYSVEFYYVCRTNRSGRLHIRYTGNGLFMFDEPLADGFILEVDTPRDYHGGRDVY